MKLAAVLIACLVLGGCSGGFNHGETTAKAESSKAAYEAVQAELIAYKQQCAADKVPEDVATLSGFTKRLTAAENEFNALSQQLQWADKDRRK